jgi:site-specific DNA-adenine methylase
MLSAFNFIRRLRFYIDRSTLFLVLNRYAAEILVRLNEKPEFGFLFCNLSFYKVHQMAANLAKVAKVLGIIFSILLVGLGVLACFR